MKGLILAAGTAVVLAGCATHQAVLQAVGGSRSDGVVSIGYERGAFERARGDLNEALQMATERCRAWGYTSAEPFGGGQQRCLVPDNTLGCLRWQVSKDFQCTGSPR